MSNSQNPFSSPEPSYRDLIPQDQLHLKKHAQRLAMLRINPPSILGAFGSWRMVVMLMGGLVLTLFAGWTFREFGRHYNTFPPVIVASMFFGALLRDIGYVVQIVRGWKLSAHFID